MDKLLTDPEAKAVVFSHWTRAYDIVLRRLEAHATGYVSFHGGVRSEKRPELVERFRSDRGCRVFLSTDAGSEGLIPEPNHARIVMAGYVPGLVRSSNNASLMDGTLQKVYW